MQTIDDYISHVGYLPPAPRVVPDLMKLLGETDIDSSRVVKLISLDPSLTVNVLRICNSAYFAAATPTTDLQEAVTRLGFQQVSQLVTAAAAAKLLAAPANGYGLDPGELWRHSVAAAVAAQFIARELGDDDGLVFTAALLHDIGKILLAQAREGSYDKIFREAELNQIPILECETKLLGVNHAEVGGRLLARWKFPPNLVAAVAHHHAPRGAGTHQRLAAFVYVGNMIAYFMGHGFGHIAFAMRGREEALAILGLAPESIPQYMMETFQQMQVIDALFSLASPLAARTHAA
jgi:putative nucleotidyltransferase with HDIG domain